METIVAKQPDGFVEMFELYYDHIQPGDDYQFVAQLLIDEAEELGQIKRHKRHNMSLVNLPRAITVATVYYTTDGFEVARGYAFCSSNEQNFNRRIGRQIAKARVLNELRKKGLTVQEKAG